jgi:hypothetical protein
MTRVCGEETGTFDHKLSIEGANWPHSTQAKECDKDEYLESA